MAKKLSLLTLGLIFAAVAQPAMAQSISFEVAHDFCASWKNAYQTCQANSAITQASLDLCQSTSIGLQDNLTQCLNDLSDATTSKANVQAGLDLCNAKGGELTTQITNLQAENEALKAERELPDDMASALDMIRCVKFLGNQAQKRNATDSRIKKMRKQCLKGAAGSRNLVLHLQSSGFKIQLVKKLK